VLAELITAIEASQLDVVTVRDIDLLSRDLRTGPADLLLQRRRWLIRDFYVTLNAWHGPLAQSVTSRHEQPRVQNTGRLLTLPVRASLLLMALLGHWMSGAGISGCRRPSWPGRPACALRWSAGYWALVRLIRHCRQ
jgi:hypothetical protein